jgi:hypothetical protein
MRPRSMAADPATASFGRVEQAEQPGEDRDQQGDLKGDVPRASVDADDLALDRLGLALELLLQLVLLMISASCSNALATFCWSAGGSTVLASAIFVTATDSVASRIAPANARPNESPNEPAAEFAPAASLTRSSEIGDSV